MDNPTAIDAADTLANGIEGDTVHEEILRRTVRSLGESTDVDLVNDPHIALMIAIKPTDALILQAIHERPMSTGELVDFTEALRDDTTRSAFAHAALRVIARRIREPLHDAIVAMQPHIAENKKRYKCYITHLMGATNTDG
ncbi:hypothetical protein [Noviherbaspirillum malthae]|uniref:hypothetical protein n=1 Tax=Noviherbaspirillum malthae TaxID=1260987 RepID=UPI00188F9F82|nr:hypothetical protein [Noviherbaspirillum malthae]